MKSEFGTVRPAETAGLLALLYVLVCAVYIIGSGAVASRLANSKQDLERIERVKGIAFVVTTGAIFSGCWYWLLRRIRDAELRLAEHQHALAMAERRALAGVFASSVAHDLNNILSVLQGELEEVRRQGAGENVQRETDQMERAIEDMVALNRRLTSLGKDRMNREPVPLDLVKVIHDAVDFGHVHKRLRECNIHIRGDATVPLKGDPNLLQQLLLNLLINAAEATNGQGAIEISAMRQDNGGAVMEISDNGPGLPEQVRARLFEPYLTTKPQGTGLGLLSVRAAAEAHGGTVELLETRAGACFRVTLPAQIA